MADMKKVMLEEIGLNLVFVIFLKGIMIMMNLKRSYLGGINL